MLTAEFRMTLDYAQIRGLMAASLLLEDPESPDDLRDALHKLLATLPKTPLATPNHAAR